MPVTPKYSWSQTYDHIEIEVLLPGVTKQRTDAFGTSALVKVVAHPYFCLIDLLHDIDPEKSVAVVKGGSVWFKLPKVRFGTAAKVLADVLCMSRTHHSNGILFTLQT
jgi:hypothetical protein